MTTNGRPGVFISESFSPLSSASPGIPGEALPAFAAAFPRGPIVPTQISSWPAFVQAYGDFTVDPGNLFPFAVYQFFQNGGNSCLCLRVPNTDASASTLTLYDINSPDPDEALVVNAISPGVWGEDIYIEVVSGGASGRANVNVYLGVTTPAGLVETYQDVSMNPADPRYVVTAINTGSSYINVVSQLGNVYSEGINDLALISPSPLTGGGDGSDAPTLNVAVPLAFDQMADQILNLNLPGVHDYTTISGLVAWAEGRGNVFVVADGPAPNGPNEVSATVATNYINLVQGGSSFPASTYIAVYAPYLLVADPSSTISGATRYLPPGGAVLGQWQQNDVLNGPQKAPGGIQNQVQAVGLEVRFTPTDLDNLNNAQVNAIQFRPGYGYCIFGVRTLHPGYPDRYISVRRVLMMLEHDLKYLTQFALFEPNDATLWTQITSVITNYLNQQFQTGVLAGDTASDAFSVVCDATNNSASAAQAGIVTAAVGVNIGSPAEWLTITVSQFQSTGTSTATTA